MGTIGERTAGAAVVPSRRTTGPRGAVYKTLHDARRRLRAHLRDAGVAPDWLETR